CCFIGGIVNSSGMTSAQNFPWIEMQEQPSRRLPVLSLLAVLCWSQVVCAQESSKQEWRTLPFAIVRYNDDAPKSWNVYRDDRKGIYLVRLWKRYLLVDTNSQDVFEIDPEKVKVEGDKAELATQDIPEEPVETSEWKTRN